MERVEQPLLERRGSRERDSREESRIDAQRDRGDRRQDREADRTPDPFAQSQRPFQGGKHTSTDEERECQRRRRSCREGEEEERCSRARSLKRGARQDQTEHGAGARRPQQPGRDAEHQGGCDARLSGRSGAVYGAREAPSQRHERLHQSRGEVRKEEREAEEREQRKRCAAPVLVGADGPTATDCGEARDQRERRGHPEQQRQPAPHERPIRSSEDERQDRQDTRADDRERPAEIDQDEQNQ